MNVYIVSIISGLNYIHDEINYGIEKLFFRFSGELETNIVTKGMEITNT